MTKLVAIVIATYNRAKPLARLLVWLENQTLPKQDWEVIVCVDGSTDDTMQLLSAVKQRRTLPLVYFWQKNAGQSMARHNAILRSRAQRVVIIDDDMEVGERFLEEHCRCAESDPYKTVVIGKVIPRHDWKEKPLYEVGREHWLLSHHNSLECQSRAPSALSFTQNVSLSRQLYLQVGGFDPQFRLNEDLELGIRLERAGGRFVFNPEAWTINHSDIGSYARWLQREYDYGKAAVQIWEKYDRDPLLHPLRNLVTGNLAKRIAVEIVAPRDGFAKLSVIFLQRFGNFLQSRKLFWLAMATHKAIAAIQYHLCLKHYFGSWQALLESQKEFERHLVTIEQTESRSLQKQLP